MGLALVVGLLRGGGIEDDLRTRVTAALADSGVTGVAVEVSGRDVTLSGLPPEASVRHTVEAVPGVRSVTLSYGAACAGLQADVDAILGEDRVRFEGDGVPAPAGERDQLVQAARLVARCAASVTVRGGPARAAWMAEVLRGEGATVAAVDESGDPHRGEVRVG